MIEFEGLTFLQNQKSGGTYVETFLRQFCATDLIAWRKHAVPWRRRPDTFYFISVRDPLDTYLSLFNYGLDGKGMIRGLFDRQGRQDLYARGIDGFEDWLNLLLDPALNDAMWQGLPAPLRPHLGLMSWRYLRLASPRFEQTLGPWTGPAAFSQHVERTQWVSAVVRQESMQADLSALVRGPLGPFMRSADAALQWLAEERRINTSRRRDGARSPDLSAATLERLQRREWWLYEHHEFTAPGPSMTST